MPIFCACVWFDDEHDAAPPLSLPTVDGKFRKIEIPLEPVSTIAENAAGASPLSSRARQLVLRPLVHRLRPKNNRFLGIYATSRARFAAMKELSGRDRSRPLFTCKGPSRRVPTVTRGRQELRSKA